MYPSESGTAIGSTSTTDETGTFHTQKMSIYNITQSDGRRACNAFESDFTGDNESIGMAIVCPANTVDARFSRPVAARSQRR